MYSFVVICDDLTGSSDQSILLKERGLSVHQMARFDPEKLPQDKADVLVINSDSRRKSVSEVSDLFERILSIWPDDVRFTKRMDTTLRGHLLLETSKILKRDPGSVALVVPAFPASGRTTVGGYQLLNGELLERTEVRKDPIWPIRSSYVPAYFQGEYNVGQLLPSDLALDMDGLVERIAKAAVHNRILVADAQNDSDIELLAMASAYTGIRFVPVDPSPFTAAYIYHTIHQEKHKPVIAVIGSSSEKTRKQLFFLNDKLRVFTEEIGPDGNRVAMSPGSFDPSFHDMLLITPTREMIPGKEDEIASALAEAAVQRMAEIGRFFCGVILSGGDTAVRFFEETSISLISSEEEIIPLMIGTVVEDGTYEGLKIVTKGGLVGEDDALYRAVAWLRKKREEI